MMAFDFKASNKASLQALEYALKDGDKEMIGMCYGLRGSLLRYLNLVGLSISSYNQSLAYAQSHRRKASQFMRFSARTIAILLPQRQSKSFIPLSQR